MQYLNPPRIANDTSGGARLEIASVSSPGSKFTGQNLELNKSPTSGAPVLVTTEAALSLLIHDSHGPRSASPIAGDKSTTTHCRLFHAFFSRTF